MNVMPSRIDAHTFSRRTELAGTGCMNASTMTTASVSTALANMHGATPRPAMIRPAIGGPTTAGALNAKLLSPIALLTNSRGTRMGTQLWRAGASKDCVAASNALKSINSPIVALPPAMTTASTSDSAACDALVTTSTRRRGKRSATTPANGEKTKTGSARDAPMSPT